MQVEALGEIEVATKLLEDEPGMQVFFFVFLINALSSWRFSVLQKKLNFNLNVIIILVIYENSK